jgi:hypothetical protein
MNRGERKERIVVVVGECSRLGAACLAQAYEQVVPIVRRSPTQEREGEHTADDEQQAMPGGRR